MQQKIIILDFGSQTTQLIGRRVRELDTFCEIIPYNKFPTDDPSVIGVILSGSPYSVHDPEAFKADLGQFVGRVPVLGICYGAQFIANAGGGRVEKTDTREYGRANLQWFDAANPLFQGFDEGSQVWMSHGDTITALPADCHVVASTGSVKFAAYASDKAPLWAVQFHPEVFHTTQGKLLLRNFVVNICGSRQEWSAASFVDSTVAQLEGAAGRRPRDTRPLRRRRLVGVRRAPQQGHRPQPHLHLRRPRDAPQERVHEGDGGIPGPGAQRHRR